MKSITRTLMISLSLTAIVIFIAAVLIVAALHVGRNKPDQSCEAALSIISETLTPAQGSDPPLAFAPTHDFNELHASSPALWFVASVGTQFFEFNRAQRPVIPEQIPYFGPITRATLNAIDTGLPTCLEVIKLADTTRVVFMIAGARPSLGLSVRAFISNELPTIVMVGGAFAAIVAAGVFLAARFVQHSIARVTKMALSINPSAPQGSIPMNEVPAELRILVQSLNEAFDEIATFIERQRRFLGNAAHELRTPLAILRAKLEDVADSKLRAALILDTRRLTALVAAMLDLSRLQNTGIKKSPVDLREVTREVLADYSPLALDQGMDLSLLSDSNGPVVVFGVEPAIRSAIANLVGNALVHAYGATTVVALLDPEGAVSICDDGAPVSQPGPTGLIVRLEDGKARHSGTGLGLSIVREIMIAHDGTLTVTASPGRGTTARLDFGRARPGDR